MKKTGKRLAAFCAAFTMLAAGSGQAFAAAPAALETEALAAAALSALYGGAESVQYAVWQDGEILLSGAHDAGQYQNRRPLTEETLYGVGSVSKMYTTAAVMTLVERGVVDLDAPVTRYVYGFQMADERYRDITVRMLLNHSAGFLGMTLNDAVLFGDPDEEASMDGLLERLSRQRLQADPGAYSVYSNDGFSLAQLLVERVSGMPFEEFVRMEITGPLGLDDTFTPQDLEEAGRLADTYAAGNGEPLPQESFQMVGAGGMYATAEDLAAFGGAFCGTELLSWESLEEMAGPEYARGMWPDQTGGDQLAYGLGWDSVALYPFEENGVQALAKGGDTIVYHAGLVVLPEYGLSAAVLTSGGNSGYNQAAAARMLAGVLAAQGVAVEYPQALPEAEPAPLPESYDAFDGYYGASNQLLYLDADPASGTLRVTPFGSSAATVLRYYSDGSFRYEGQPLLCRLVQEENGQAYFYQKTYTEIPGLGVVAGGAYAAERLPEHAVSSEVQAAWNARSGKIYLLVNEKYSSAFYQGTNFLAALSTAGGPEGYLANLQMAGPGTLLSCLQIPGTGSRDSYDIHMEVRDGVEYLWMNDFCYRDAGSIELLQASGAASYNIPLGGDPARWFAAAGLGGKTLTVDITGPGAFYVYDAATLQMVGSSWLYGDRSVVLPENALVLFAGGCSTLFRTEVSG